MAGEASLKRIFALDPAERSFAIRGAAGCCFALASYTVLRPIRDELGIRGGVENLQLAFTSTFFGMLFFVPLFGFVATKLPKRLLIPAAYLFFATNLAGFSAALRLGVTPELFARVFFSWVSIFNLVIVSLYWTILADRCSEARARVLFGPIAAGGSFGAFLGPLITSQFVRSLGAPFLLLLSAALLLIAALIAGRLPVLSSERIGRVLQNEAIGGEILQGLSDIAKSPFLRRMALLTFLGNILGTTLYFEQAAILARDVADSIRRTEILSYIDLSANSLTLFFQLFLTPICLKRIPPRLAFSIVPAVLLVGFPILALFPAMPVLFGFQTIRRASGYALGKPIESLLYSMRSDEEGYKARNVIDTLVYRLGDTSGAWLANLMRGEAAQFLWQLSTPLACTLLLITAYELGREHEQAVALKPK